MGNAARLRGQGHYRGAKDMAVANQSPRTTRVGGPLTWSCPIIPSASEKDDESQGSRIDKPCDLSFESFGKGGLGNARPARGVGDADGMETVETYQCHEDCPIRILDEQAPAVGNAFSSERKTDTTGARVLRSTSSKNVGDGNGVYDGLSGASRFSIVRRRARPSATRP